MKRENNPKVALVFVIYIFLTTFFVMNLFISVIVDKFNEEIKKVKTQFSQREKQMTSNTKNNKKELLLHKMLLQQQLEFINPILRVLLMLGVQGVMPLHTT